MVYIYKKLKKMKIKNLLNSWKTKKNIQNHKPKKRFLYISIYERQKFIFQWFK